MSKCPGEQLSGEQLSYTRGAGCGACGVARGDRYIIWDIVCVVFVSYHVHAVYGGQCVMYAEGGV